MTPSKVFIVNTNAQYSSMFLANLWEIVDNPEEADLVQFTGGEDVSPELYGHKPHPKTNSNYVRDLEEVKIFNECMFDGIAMAGICRGAQFLHVMSGGTLYQHVDKHAVVGLHEAYDTIRNEVVGVSSTHHQMMEFKQGGDQQLLMYANLGSERVSFNGISERVVTSQREEECIFHHNTGALCYQPHPEFFNKNHPCQETYFKYLNMFC